MAQQRIEIITVDRGPQADLYVPPHTVGVRLLLCVVVIVPLLLAAGVYWVRHVPDHRAFAASDGIVEVQVLPLRENVAEVHAAALPADQTAASSPEPLIQDPKRTIPDQATAPVVTQPPMPATKPAAGPPAIPGAPEQNPIAPTAAAFQYELLRHIARFRFYPDQARRDGIQGTVQLMFAMQRDGTVSDIWVKTSSGSGVLDNAAVETVRRAQPLPPIPVDLPGTLNILIPVAFGLP